MIYIIIAFIVFVVTVFLTCYIAERRNSWWCLVPALFATISSVILTYCPICMRTSDIYQYDYIEYCENDNSLKIVEIPTEYILISTKTKNFWTLKHDGVKYNLLKKGKQVAYQKDMNEVITYIKGE